MVHAVWLHLASFLCAFFLSSAEKAREFHRQDQSDFEKDGNGDHDRHESKAALLRQQAYSTVLQSEKFAKELSDILNIDKIAANPSLQASHEIAHKNKAVNAELHKLQHMIGTPNLTTDADAGSAIRHAQNSIRTLLDDEMHKLEKETRKESDGALQAARGVENTAIGIARTARAEADDYARTARAEADDDYARAAEDEADDLSRRAEAAAVKLQRKGESLTVRIVDALRKNMDEADAKARHDAESQHRHLARMVDAQAAPASLLEAGVDTSSPRAYALLILVGAACAGIATRGMTRNSFVDSPTALLG